MKSMPPQYVKPYVKTLLRIVAGFATGTLSYSKVRAMTRVADTHNKVEEIFNCGIARWAEQAQH